MLQAEAGAQPEDETRQAVVVPLARTPIKPEPALRAFHTIRRRRAHAHAEGRRGARGVDRLRRRAVEADDSHRRRDRSARERADAHRGRRGSSGDGAGAAAPARRAAERSGRMALRRARDRARAVHDVQGSPRAGHPLPDVPAARDLGGSARSDAGSAGALPAVRRAGARHRRAGERQVDAAQRVRRSHQSHAQRPCDYDRVADRVRAREPAVVHQPARVARRCRAGRDIRACRAARRSRRHDDRGSEVGRPRLGGARSGRVRAAGAGIGARVLDDWGARAADRGVPGRSPRQGADVARDGAARRRRPGAAAARRRAAAWRRARSC